MIYLIQYIFLLILFHITRFVTKNMQHVKTNQISNHIIISYHRLTTGNGRMAVIIHWNLEQLVWWPMACDIMWHLTGLIWPRHMLWEKSLKTGESGEQTMPLLWDQTAQCVWHWVVQNGSTIIFCQSKWFWILNSWKKFLRLSYHCLLISDKKLSLGEARHLAAHIETMVGSWISEPVSTSKHRYSAACSRTGNRTWSAEVHWMASSLWRTRRWKVYLQTSRSTNVQYTVEQEPWFFESGCACSDCPWLLLNLYFSFSVSFSPFDVMNPSAWFDSYHFLRAETRDWWWVKSPVPQSEMPTNGSWPLDWPRTPHFELFSEIGAFWMHWTHPLHQCLLDLPLDHFLPPDQTLALLFKCEA